MFNVPLYIYSISFSMLPFSAHDEKMSIMDYLKKKGQVHTIQSVRFVCLYLNPKFPPDFPPPDPLTLSHPFTNVTQIVVVNLFPQTSQVWYPNLDSTKDRDRVTWLMNEWMNEWMNAWMTEWLDTLCQPPFTNRQHVFFDTTQRYRLAKAKMVHWDSLYTPPDASAT